MWGTLLGAGAMGAGSYLSYRGEAAGADAMIREQARQNAEQAGFDAEHDAAVGRFASDIAASPPTLRIGARTMNGVSRAAAAMPANGAVARSAGVDPSRLSLATSSILPRAAGAARGQAGQAVSGELALGAQQLGAQTDDVAFRRRNRSRFYGNRMQRAGQKGAGSRETGRMLSLGGSALMSSGLGGYDMGSIQAALAPLDSSSAAVPAR